MEGEGLRSIFASPQLKDKDNDDGERDGGSPKRMRRHRGVELHGSDGLLVDSVGAKKPANNMTVRVQPPLPTT